jgi:hypothetical protein
MALDINQYERIHASMKRCAMEMCGELIDLYNAREKRYDGKCNHECDDSGCEHKCDGVNCMYEMKANITYTDDNVHKERMTNLLFTCEAMLYSSGYFATLKGRRLRNNDVKVRVTLVKMTKEEYAENIKPVDDLD